jgi:uncharacterized protein (DUF433 family)
MEVGSSANVAKFRIFVAANCAKRLSVLREVLESEAPGRHFDRGLARTLLKNSFLIPASQKASVGVSLERYRMAKNKMENGRTPMQTKPRTRIVSNERILGGTPVVEGTRVPADNVLAEVRNGKDKFEIFRTYPSLPLDGVEACLAWEKSGRPV